MLVRMLKRKTLAEAYSLARLQEITVAALQQKPRLVFRSDVNSTVSSYNRPLMVTASIGNQKNGLNHKSGLNSARTGSLFKKGNGTLPSKEFDEKRAKNQYYQCDERYTPGHIYKKKQIYVMQIKKILDDQEEEEAIGWRQLMDRP